MVGTTIALAVAATLATTVEASPFKGFPWVDFTPPGWWQSPHTATESGNGEPGPPWWHGHTTTHTSISSVSVSSAHTSTSKAVVSHSSQIASTPASFSTGTASISSTKSSSPNVSPTSTGFVTVSTLSTKASSSGSLSACPKPRSRSSYGSGSGSAPASTPSASVSSTVISSSRVGGSTTSSGYAPSGTSTIPPCARIAQLVASSSSSGAAATPTVPAKLGYDCLNSIPFNASAAVAYLDSIRPYLEWQTTIEYLKNPPAEYAAKVQPPYDFTANFERIYNNAVSGSYASEYAFGFDLYTAFQTAHDGHFVIYPDSVTTLITFGRRTPLVSVSVDGQSIPQVFAYSDILAASFGNASYTPSPLSQINGQDSTQYLLNFSQIGSLQDRDALWNNMFYEPAQVALGSSGTGTGTFSGSGRGRLIYPGPDTTLTFANGTSTSTQNYARVLVSFRNITNGQDLYNKYLIPKSGEPQSAEEIATASTASASATASRVSSGVSRSASATASSTTTIPAPGYPTNPVIREKVNLNSGYFLEGEGYDDVAVLAVNSFVSSLSDEIPFQSVNTYLINQAVKYNKTKLIVDVSANGGGTILQGYDLFKQLFPSILPYGANRFRAHETYDIVGQEFSAYSERVPRSLSTNQTVQDIVSSTFNYQTDLDENYEPFTSWAEKYGPHAYGPKPDNFSSLLRWNLSDVLTPDNSGGIYVSGYLNRSNITVQPFRPENIVVVTDGYCASTCTIFSELMRQQGGVKYVALGGRPNKDITQAVGGVKGTNDFAYADIISFVEQVFAEPLLKTRDYYNTTALGKYNDLALVRSSASVANVRDGIREGDASQTPLQFVYEPADCRIYYTPEMTVDITAAWRAVADSAFNGINHCVAGGLGSTAATNRRTVAPHKQHSSHEKRMLLDSIASINLGQGRVTKGGDSVMII